MFLHSILISGIYQKLIPQICYKSIKNIFNKQKTLEMPPPKVFFFKL